MMSSTLTFWRTLLVIRMLCRRMFNQGGWLERKRIFFNGLTQLQTFIPTPFSRIASMLCNYIYINYYSWLVYELLYDGSFVVC